MTQDEVAVKLTAGEVTLLLRALDSVQVSGRKFREAVASIEKKLEDALKGSLPEVS